VAVASSLASVNAPNQNAKRLIVAAAKFSSKGDSKCHPQVIQTLTVATVAVMEAVMGIMETVTIEVVEDMAGTGTEEMQATTMTTASITPEVVERVVIDGKMHVMKMGEEVKETVGVQKRGEGKEIVAFH